jgi:hypothetical protein
MKIISCRQGTPEWLSIRLGKVTASEIDALVSPEGKIRTGQGPQTYLYKKLSEKLLGFAPDQGSTFAMNQGSLLENECLPWFEFEFNTPIQRVGFCTSDDGRIGFSPDGLIGGDSGIEAKCFQPPHSLQTLLDGVVPKENIVQIQMSLMISERKSWKFVSYSRQWPALVLTVERDEKIIAAIRSALDQFLERFDEAFARISKIRDDYNAKRNAEDGP